MATPRYTWMQHVAAVATVLVISMVFHGAIQWTGVGPRTQQGNGVQQTRVMLPPTLR